MAAEWVTLHNFHLVSFAPWAPRWGDVFVVAAVASVAVAIAEDHSEFVACAGVVMQGGALSHVALNSDFGLAVVASLVAAAAVVVVVVVAAAGVAAAADSIVSFEPLLLASPGEPMSVAVASLANDYSEML